MHALALIENISDFFCRAYILISPQQTAPDVFEDDSRLENWDIIFCVTCIPGILIKQV